MHVYMYVCLPKRSCWFLACILDAYTNTYMHTCIHTYNRQVGQKDSAGPMHVFMMQGLPNYMEDNWAVLFLNQEANDDEQSPK